MRSLAVGIGIIIFAVLLLVVASAYAQGYGYGMGPGMMGGGQNYCPCCGAYQGRGYGMGPGMMGGGYGMGPGMMREHGYGQGGYQGGYASRPQSEACQAFLTETQGQRKELAGKIFEYREAMRNPKTSSENLSSMEKQINDLQGKIQAKNTQGCWW